MRIINKLLVFCLLVSSVAVCSAQQGTRKITLEDLWAYGTFRQSGVYGIRSMNDGEHYTTLEKNKIVKSSYKTGKAVETIFDLSKIKDTKIKRIQDYTFSPDESKILITTNIAPIYRHSFTADYYVYNRRTKELRSLSTKGKQQLATFSPNSSKIAFVRENNIFICDLRFETENQVTFDGKFNHIINGAPDWVYEEEFGFSKAFGWSADGANLAYMKFDESKVRVFHMNMFQGMRPSYNGNKLYPSNYSYKYPKAGETNSVVSVHVYNLKDKTTLDVNVGDEKDQYIPRIKWTKDPKTLSVIRMNRHQNQLEILLANAKTGESRVMYKETNKYYIAESNLDNLIYLEDGKHFIFSSEKSGYSHIYLFDMTGREVKAITKGNYDVIDFYGYNSKTKTFYYSSHEVSPTEKYVYSIKLNGKGKKKLTNNKGWNEAAFSKNHKYFINNFSNATTPRLVTLNYSKGKVIRTLEDNKKLKDVLSAYKFNTKEFIKIPAADGKTMLNAWMIKPLDFDENKKYPVLMTQYSGPNSQQVRNNWSINWNNYLAQEGYVVVCVDPRGTGARGEEFRKCTYMQLGKLESDDQIAAAKWLAKQGYVDGKRIAIWGWSYGGFMSSLCLMKGNDVFSAAIAVAPVTNWRYYDSVYTERFMRTPQENAAGYDDNSPINWVDKLKGNLLICHGTADDNVHVQNAYELTERLVQANKQFEMQIYTNRNHGIYGGMTRLHLYKRFMKFLNEKL
jgi:dipeptidyl-peptidase-4